MASERVKKMEKNKLIFMVGIPGAGKSTYAENLAAKENYIVHSSDNIRKELGDINDQSRNKEVFEILHRRVKEDLAAGKNVIYDTCGIKRKDRMNFLREIKHIPCYKICVLIATPYEYCLAQNFARERRVPEDVMARFYKNFQMPCKEEGFDDIIIHYEKEEWRTYYGDVMKYVDSLLEYDQNNKHHTATLGEHMLFAGYYVLRENGNVMNDVAMAAFTHDIGKPDTRSFFNGKGEATEDAHYYSHHNVGAYKSLFFEYPNNVRKHYVALLIELHMKPLMEWKQSSKAKRKDINLFGDDIINDVELLNASDVAGH